MTKGDDTNLSGEPLAVLIGSLGLALGYGRVAAVQLPIMVIASIVGVWLFSIQQFMLLPECLDDFVGEGNPVRVVDAFIEELDLAVLGFAGVVPEATGPHVPRL